MPGVKVLLVEDDDGIAGPLCSGLAREGFVVQRAATVAEARAADDYELVVLDLRLPDGDGLDLCRDLRAASAVPIIIVSARGEEADRVVGLEMGADDYLVKPFGLRELIARIRAVSRRSIHSIPDAPPDEAGGVTSWDDLVIDSDRRTLTRAGTTIEVTAKEFDLLDRLVRAHGAVVTRADLMRDVWGTSWYGASKTIDMHVANLRRKLGDASLIETVRGIGYRMRESAGG